MTIKLVASVLLNILAALVPPSVLYTIYGSSRINTQSLHDTIWLFVAALFSFSVSWFASSLLKQGAPPEILRVAEMFLRGAKKTD